MFLIHGNIIDTSAERKFNTLQNGYLAIDCGKICGIYSNNTLPNEFKNCEIFNYNDKLVIPGLTDIHVHAPQYTFRGLGMDMELLDWLNTYTFPEEAKYSQISYANDAYTKFVDDLRKSPTTRACIFATIHIGATYMLMDLLEKSGLVTMVGKVNMDRNSPDYLVESTEQSVNDTKNWVETSKKTYKNTMPIVTPRFIPSCTDELMNALSDIRNEYKIGLQSHLSENPSEVAWVKELCPDSRNYLEAYKNRNSLCKSDIKTIMAHCVYCVDDEISLLKKHDVYVAHCPQSNANLSSGIAPLRKYIKKRLNIGLGSDIAAGQSLNMLDVTADAVAVSKLYWRYIDNSQEPLSTSESFYLATRGGGSYFGKVGAFEKGYDADVVIIDDSQIRTKSYDSLEQRITRAVYLNCECEITAKFVKGNKLF